MRYYEIFHAGRRYGVAYAPKGVPVLYLPLRGEIENWEPVSLELRDGEYPDYLASNITTRLCSEHMRVLLDHHASEYDFLQWLEFHVSHKKEVRTYYYLHFPSPPDVLDQEHSISAEGIVTLPVLARDKAERHNVFTFIGCEDIALVVSQQVRRAMTEAGLTGISIETVKVV